MYFFFNAMICSPSASTRDHELDHDLREGKGHIHICSITSPAAPLETVNWHSGTLLRGGLNVNNRHYPSLQIRCSLFSPVF